MKRNKFILLVTINPNKSPNDEIYQINNPQNITQDLSNYFKSKISDKIKLLNFKTGGLFDVHPKYPDSNINEANVVVGMEGFKDTEDAGKRGLRRHWHCEIFIDINGKIRPWGNGKYSRSRKNENDSVRTSPKYFNKLKHDIFKIFYDRNIITWDQFNYLQGMYFNVSFKKYYEPGEYTKKENNFIQ